MTTAGVRVALTPATSVAAAFGTAVPSPITAAMTTYTPAYVYLFGGGNPSVYYTYQFNPSIVGTFPTMIAGSTSSPWATSVTAATNWLNGSIFDYFLFDSANVAQVDRALQVRNHRGGVGCWVSFYSITFGTGTSLSLSLSEYSIKAHHVEDKHENFS